MELSSILKPEAVRVLSAASSKKRLFQEIADVAEVTLGLDAQVVVDGLLERGSLGPTGVGHGVALPHARMTELETVSGVFVMLEKPIDFASVDRPPVDIAFALFAPEEAAGNHLKALAMVSRTLRDTAVCTKLRANPDPVKLYAILTEAKSMQAA